MKFRRSQHRKDTTHAPNVAYLEEHGVKFADTSMVGFGFPDGFAAKNGRTAAIEFKSDGKSQNEKQLVWWYEWPGAKFVVETEADADRVLDYLEGGDSL